MRSDPSMSRVTRLENDTESLYDIVTAIRSTVDGHTGRLDSIDRTLAEVLRRLPEPT